MTKKYYIEENDDDYTGKHLIGPDGFQCTLGEPEDCSWYRDGGLAVFELNRLADRVEALELEMSNQ